jgi:catechol 2,3-dioxygenase-like lactoylglutathione lyase family enzyme
MDYRLEVIGIPVSDVDASKTFYSDVVGFAVDHDISPGPGMRVVQLTRPVRPARLSSVRACR